MLLLVKFFVGELGSLTVSRVSTTNACVPILVSVPCCVIAVSFQ